LGDERGLQALQIDDRKRRGAAFHLAADIHGAAVDGRHARASGKTQVDDLGFLKRALFVDRKHMQLAIARHHVQGFAVSRRHARGIHQRAKGNRADNGTCTAQRLDGTGAGCHDRVAADVNGAAPVISFVGIVMLPHHCTRKDIDAGEEAIVVGTGGEIHIARAHIRIVVVNRDRGVRLCRIAELVGGPHSSQVVGRKSLHGTAVKRDHDHALSVNGARGVADGGDEVSLRDHFARRRIDLEQAVVYGKVHETVYDDGLAGVGVLRAGVLLVVERPVRLHIVGRSCRCGGTGLVASPIRLPIGARRGGVDRHLVEVRKHVRSMHPGNGVAGFERKPSCAVDGLPVDQAIPSTFERNARWRGYGNEIPNRTLFE